MAASAFAVRRLARLFARRAGIDDNHIGGADQGNKFLFPDLVGCGSRHGEITGQGSRFDGQITRGQQRRDAAINKVRIFVPKGAQCPDNAAILAPAIGAVCDCDGRDRR